MLVQVQEQRIQAKPDPQMILANSLLGMSCLELTQAVLQEIADNPALETEDDMCSSCTAPGELCPGCVNGPEAPTDAPNAHSWRDVPTSASSDDEIADPVALIPERITLRDHLLFQLGTVVDEADREIAEHLVCAVDDNGYLKADLAELAAICRTTVSHVERVLSAVQSLDPPGVAARDLRECLLLQLDTIASDGGDVLVPISIVRDYWPEMVARRYAYIARKIGVKLDDVEAAVAFIRKTLTPYPGASFRPAWDKDRHKAVPGVKPDVIVLRDRDGQFCVEVIEYEASSIRISPSYVQLWREMQKHPHVYTEGDREHVAQLLSRAHMFVRGLEQRRELLRKVAECIVEEQRPFFESGCPEDLRPLTQCRLAALLHVHESTISRGVADKYMQLPNGDLVSFRFFFGKALSAKHMVKIIVQQEDPTAPYSDQQISDILKHLGYAVARRTVMKYREEMSILSSRHRALARWHSNLAEA
ncbi:MAG: RNA polymerase factor sigma-54 [Armatimonadota bacterium]